MDKVRMQCPDGVTAISVAGSQYAADSNGIVEIPAEYESSVYCFGLVRAKESTEATGQKEEQGQESTEATGQKKAVKGKS